MSVLTRVWEGWKRIAHHVGEVQTTVIMSVFYFLVIGPMGLGAMTFRRDLLRARRRSESYYREHSHQEDSVDRYQHQS